MLAGSSRVLDAGCGEGRNALCLARAGHRVDALDVSDAGVRALTRRAEAEGLPIRAWVGDLRSLRSDEVYDLAVCHGVLHLLPRDEWREALDTLRASTRPGGVDGICVFTGEVPCPPDLVPVTHGLFVEAEPFDLYADWEIEEARAYVFEGEYPGGLQHVHAANKVVAWKPRRA